MKVKTDGPNSGPPEKPLNKLNEGGNNRSPSQQFIMLALDMSWRLAIAVLVPIIGGYYLGRSLKAQTALLIAGFIIAILGAAGVMIRTSHQAAESSQDHHA